MNAKDTLNNAGRIAVVWNDLAALRRRAASTNSRARRMGAQGQITVDELAEALAATGGKCSTCPKRFGPQRRDRWIICYHVPLSMSGECDIANVDIVCQACEMSRAAKLGVKWEGSDRARTARNAPRGSLPPSPVESTGTPPLVFHDDEGEDG